MYEVYGSPNCVYCERAVDLLEDNNLPYKYINLVEDQNKRDEFIANDWRTVPQVFFITAGEDAFHIGGFKELKGLIG